MKKLVLHFCYLSRRGGMAWKWTRICVTTLSSRGPKFIIQEMLSREWGSHLWMSSHGYRRLVELFDTCFLFIPSLSFKKISLFGLWKKKKGAWLTWKTLWDWPWTVPRFWQWHLLKYLENDKPRVFIEQLNRHPPPSRKNRERQWKSYF